MSLNLNLMQVLISHLPRLNLTISVQSICPPREVRDFRVIVARDARTEKKPGNRTAQITVWNVLNLVFDEGGKAGAFAEGQKFLVSPPSLSLSTRRLNRC
jgi:hypothetical protein